MTGSAHVGRRAVVVAVGDELLAGVHPDLNSPEIAHRLLSLGVATAGVTVAGDDEAPLTRALAAAMTEAELVLVTGGLGPTLDDLTRHALAAAAGRELLHSEEAWDQVTAWYAKRGAPIPETNRRQALAPRGAAILPNRVGTAPGLRLELDGCVVFALPGPPAEMRDMLEREVLPWIERTRDGGRLGERRFYLFGLSESVFAEEVGPWMERDANPLMGCSVKAGILTVVLRARGATEDEVRGLLDERAREFRRRFDEHLFSEEEAALEQVLGRLLIERGLSVSAAESCTAGLAVSLLGRVPGISEVLSETYVTYSNEAKTRLLGVAPELLARHGAVSEETAGAMALGAARAAGARAAFAITGVAGPDGGTEEKPVGTVSFGTALDGEVETATRRLPPTNRDHIRALAARTALFLLFKRIAAHD